MEHDHPCHQRQDLLVHNQHLVLLLLLHLSDGFFFVKKTRVVKIMDAVIHESHCGLSGYSIIKVTFDSKGPPLFSPSERRSDNYWSRATYFRATADTTLKLIEKAVEYVPESMEVVRLLLGPEIPLDRMPKGRVTTLHIHFETRGIPRHDLSCLFKSLTFYTHLEFLDLELLELSKREAEALLVVLKSNTTLARLSLNCFRFSDSAMDLLYELTAGTESLREMTLFQLFRSAGMPLLHSLSRSASISSFTTDAWLSLGEAEVRYLADFLKKNVTLVSLTFWCNRLASLECLEKTVRCHNGTLLDLKIKPRGEWETGVNKPMWTSLDKCLARNRNNALRRSDTLLSLLFEKSSLFITTKDSE